MNSASGDSPASGSSTFNIREVYKAGWVRPLSDFRKAGAFGRRYERLWSVFCVHDDIQPFLEFYDHPKSASAHNPLWFTSLIQCLHISPSIVIQGDSYEFVVTLTSTSLRLGTANREQMNEWVEVLRNRLRDIGVLEPKENFYSREPEGSKAVLLTSTRDPTSPLPLPPPVSNPAPPDIEESDTEPDTLYSVTETNLPSTEHVTVISVDTSIHQEIADPFEEVLTSRQQQLNPFSTRVRIASAPSSMQDTLEAVESGYETIFAPPPVSRSVQRSNLQSTNSSSELVHPELPSRQANTSATAAGEVVLRPAALRGRDALRRTVSVGPEVTSVATVASNHSRDTLLESSRAALQSHRSLALIPIQAAASSVVRDRRRDGLMINPILLPRSPGMAPTLFVAPAPPASSLLPLAARLSGAPFRPPAALQPMPTNLGGNEMAFSLKERQVARLRMEMQHPAGVRILLKKKDCVNTIALVDALGTVWVAGWRQKEKPLLYNAFHIGDQIVCVEHCSVSSAAEVNRLIKNDGGSQVEFIVRRMPFGRVFHLRRDSQGQNVGIVTDVCTAEVREIVASGVAAQQGVPPLAVSPLTSSTCTWTLTEINGRPLNICSKEGEARDRLNAVGKAITVLVQPTDFVKLLKRQLKSLRGYKDYLLG